MTGPFGLSKEATGTLPPDFFKGDVHFICFSYPEMGAELFAFADDTP
jgi:hypothetical protein